MLTHLKQWLEPPVFPGDEEETSQARMMNTLGLYFLVALGITTFVFIPLFAKRPVESLVAPLVLFGVYIISRVLLFRGQLRLAGGLMVTAGWVSCAVLVLLGDGVNSPVIVAVVVITLAMRLLFRMRVGNTLLVLSIIGGLGLAIFQQSGGILPQIFSYSPLSVWFFFALALVLMSFTMDLVMGRLESTLALARQQNIARQQAEATLRESEARLIQIASTMQEVVWLRDTQTLEILYVNPAYETVWGRSCASLYQNPTSFLEAVHPDDKERVLKAIAVQRATGTGFNQEYRIIQPNANVRWVWGRTFPIRNETGQVYRITAVVEDITEHKQLDAEIQRKTEQLQALRQIGMEITAELDQNSVLRSITDRAVRLCGGTTSSLYLYRQEQDLIERVVFSGPALVPSASTRKRGEGLTGKVWETNAPVLVNDYINWQERSTHYDAYPSRAVVGVPIRYGNDFLGVLNVIADSPKTFSSADVEVLSMFADQAAIAIKNAQLYTAVRNLAVTDKMTGLFNRSFFDAELTHLEQSRNFPISIVMADLDNLKITNDRLGHPVGDELIKSTVRVLQSVFRTSDILVRIGGDEFVVLLPNTAAATASQILERVRAKLIEHNAQHPDLPIELSLGATTAEKGKLMDAFTSADQRMYADKAVRKSQASA